MRPSTLSTPLSRFGSFLSDLGYLYWATMKGLENGDIERLGPRSPILHSSRRGMNTITNILHLAELFGSASSSHPVLLSTFVLLLPLHSCSLVDDGTSGTLSYERPSIVVDERDGELFYVTCPFGSYDPATYFDPQQQGHWRLS
ncbi:hypothetical protein FFLO_06446 [Filobasidium floriforme]|uniref:Uncharacterized protein n=1 Tax=Filobasidium floriforme TaxID=5210 RepID=A0A8K0JGS2_9TREE|nr:uncharacterized protein HD553DRAFT_327263 [Filobasidium floriforme]KAG7528039.1 hypothetical protein FFLO_06446 [Filobasidium floriforme]KAH8077666.1 hypothetical protein HD553DRAFT_327263 [Filobasidium floriforme]